MTKFEPAYVVDTVALVRYLTDKKKLGKIALSIFEAAENGETQLIISAIVLVELYGVHKKKELFDDFAETYKELEQHPAYQFVSYTPGEVLDFEKHEKITGFHDRMIAGLAIRLGIPILTDDRNIKESGLVKIVWD